MLLDGAAKWERCRDGIADGWSRCLHEFCHAPLTLECDGGTVGLREHQVIQKLLSFEESQRPRLRHDTDFNRRSKVPLQRRMPILGQPELRVVAQIVQDNGGLIWVIGSVGCRHRDFRHHPVAGLPQVLDGREHGEVDRPVMQPCRAPRWDVEFQREEIRPRVESYTNGLVLRKFTAATRIGLAASPTLISRKVRIRGEVGGRAACPGTRVCPACRPSIVNAVATDPLPPTGRA